MGSVCRCCITLTTSCCSVRQSLGSVCRHCTQHCLTALHLASQLQSTRLKAFSQVFFLGIGLDTNSRRLQLPDEKLRRLKVEIESWATRQVCTKREVLSLIGQLEHACCVVKPGRSFLQRTITLSTVAKQLHHRVWLNKSFRSDLQWWAQFLQNWNGVGMMSAVAWCGFGATITSDASGSWGCGAYVSSGEWFQLEWPSSWQQIHITVKELLPVVLSVAIWGSMWQGKAVHCRCDNAAVVAILK